MSIVDLLSVPGLGQPRLSPDGTEVIFVRTDADWDANRDVSHIWRVGIEGGDPVQLTRGESGETSPRWSPDGRSIAFLADRDEDSGTQIYLLEVRAGEARSLTAHPTVVSNIQWSPDGGHLYFLAEDEKPPAERERAERGDDVYLLDEDWEHRRLWRVRVADGATECLTGDGFSVWDYALSRDGQQMVLHGGPNPLMSSLDATEVWIADADGSEMVRLTQNRVPEQVARLSPDGTQVLFTSASNQTFEPYYTNRIFLVPAGGGETRILMEDLPHQVLYAEWAPPGDAVLFVASRGVRRDLYRHEFETGETIALTDGDHAVTAWHFEPRSGRSIVGISTAQNPGDLWLLEGDGTLQRITRLYDDLAQNFVLPRQERVEWRGEDGTVVEGILDYPVGYVEGRRYPLVVQTHGGPRGADTFGWGFWLNYTQVLTGRGWAVLKPNYRGSAGYGDDFMRDMVGHYFRNAHLDVMSGVERVVGMGVADPERMVKMGWSAGGHMTNRVITHTDRFKAASSGAGGANFLSFYAQSDIRGYSYRDQWFGGAPWRKDSPYDVIQETSPVYDAWKVTTPTIFQVGAEDARVPMAQSVEMFRALQANGVPTHLYVAPQEPHVYQELRHRLFKVNAELAWFERWALDREYVWEEAPGSGGMDAGDSSIPGRDVGV